MKLTYAAAISALSLITAGGGQAQDTVKIGALMMDSGPLAAFYQYSVKGLETGVAEVNATGGINGKKVELVQMTYSGAPEAAIQTATRLVKTDRVAAITGMTPTAVSLAISGRATALNTIIVDALSVAGRRCNQNFFRVKASDAMQSASYNAFLAQNRLESWDVLAVDNSSGHDNVDSFTASVEEHGGKVQKKLFTPVPNADFGTLITQLNQEPAKGLMAVVYGTDGVTFSKQQQQFGLSAKYDMILGNNYAMPAVLQAMGDSALGVIQNMNYIPAVEGEGPRKFADAFQEIAGYQPDDVAFDMYMSVIYIAAAMNKAGSEDASAVATAMEGLRIDSPVGEVEMRAADHQLIRPVIFAQVVPAADPQPGKTMDYEIRTVIQAADYAPPPSDECRM